MKKNTSISSLLIFAVILLSVTGCATIGGESTNNGPTTTPENVSYTVKSGDSLGDIAQRLTGQFNNWKAIAEHNGIGDPRTLAAGQTILIPGKLMSATYAIETPNTLANAADNEKRAEPGTPAASVQVPNPTPVPVTTGNGVSVVRGLTSADAGNETAPITVTPVEINRSFELEPMDISPLSELKSAGNDAQALMVRVIGTYYPKGIYAQPANYARLIRRVAPGTLFQLESEVNDWYKIKTEEGIAYIRRSDSTLAEQQPDQ